MHTGPACDLLHPLRPPKARLHNRVALFLPNVYNALPRLCFPRRIQAPGAAGAAGAAGAHSVALFLPNLYNTTVLEDMVIPTYFPTLLAEIHFLRFNVC